ncbi:MAG: hypothetical protein R2699_06060 [Acidimicrobiales bacterium]
MITLWKDYRDLGTLMAGGPPNWQERFEAGDLSWMFDATGPVWIARR